MSLSKFRNTFIAKWLDRALWEYAVKSGVVLCGKSDAPAPPDPNVTAAAQLQTNIGTANATTGLNRPDIHGPTGSQTWSMRPGADPNNPQPGDWIQTNSLAPSQQAQMNQQNQLAERVGQGLNTPMNTGSMPGQVGSIGQNLPGMGQSPTSPGANNVAQALYQKQTGFLDPQFKNQDDELASRLAAQGITQGSDAYNREMGNQSRAKEFSYGQARDSAILASGAEDSRQFGQSLATGQFDNSVNQQVFNQQAQAGQFQNNSRQQELANIIAQRNQPLNELNALRSGSQSAMPQFQAPGQAGQVGNVDYAGMVNSNYGNQVANTNASNAQNANMWGSVGSLGAAAMLAPAGTMGAIGGALAMF